MVKASHAAVTRSRLTSSTSSSSSSSNTTTTSVNSSSNNNTPSSIERRAEAALFDRALNTRHVLNIVRGIRYDPQPGDSSNLSSHSRLEVQATDFGRGLVAVNDTPLEKGSRAVSKYQTMTHAVGLICKYPAMEERLFAHMELKNKKVHKQYNKKHTCIICDSNTFYLINTGQKMVAFHNT